MELPTGKFLSSESGLIPQAYIHKHVGGNELTRHQANETFVWNLLRRSGSTCIRNRKKRNKEIRHIAHKKTRSLRTQNRNEHGIIEREINKYRGK
jgi:hypothetical protein